MSAKKFMENTALLPQEIQDAIKNKVLTLVDSVVYSAKPLKASTTVELMTPSDTQKVGTTNVNNRKLEAGQFMLVSGVRLATATVAQDATDEQIAAADFSGALNAVVANGELDIIVAGKTILPRNSNRRFVTGTAVALNNYFALDCPKLVVPQAEIVPTLYLSQSTGGTVAARLELHGVRTVRA